MKHIYTYLRVAFALTLLCSALLTLGEPGPRSTVPDSQPMHIAWHRRGRRPRRRRRAAAGDAHTG